MLYYGEEQELGPEEITEKLVLAQKMVEEIRRRPPFLTQRELVDEEADEAQERRCLQLWAVPAHTCFICGARKKQQAKGQRLVKQPSLNIPSNI